ncbi:hypothetical protein GV794_07945 [Nocardia cyriacigeorgica]|uniref:Uncharacterized protein n=1 Tax=Nocardia cyriacigeorgica TaxID=135487 RepID=A0ABX0CHF7_9NOCA|nr:hypothetical protein [Nocardia cyriacigeorgica]NEW55584.1 hypothetical protein [Nocardia cyriacigeorgica]
MSTTASGTGRAAVPCRSSMALLGGWAATELGGTAAAAVDRVAVNT